jgi:5-enolpyruvylshikimate-3-phosphate synthase
MPLPPLIEIVPLEKPVQAQITVPGSKSITNRALLLAALADGETTLQGALWSEDTQVMAECLQKLGFQVQIVPDPSETCNRTITVRGLGGKIPQSNTTPLELFVGNAGTAARFLSALVCLGQGPYRLSGVPRMHERPQAPLFHALRQLGYRIDSPNNRLPAVIHGAGPRPGRCAIGIEQSSQFASALLLCSKAAGWQIDVTGQDPEEISYVSLTEKMLDVFPKHGGAFQIEPDCSSGSYFLAANTGSAGFQPASLHTSTLQNPNTGSAGFQPASSHTSTLQNPNTGSAGFQLASLHTSTLQNPNTGSAGFQPASSHTSTLQNPISVLNWPHSGWQMDQSFLQKPFHSLSRSRDLGDSIMTAIVIAPLLAQPAQFTDLGRLRLQECERVQALRTELTRCGAKVVEQGDTLTVYPSPLHGAEIETYNDHRMAMCFAILGLKVPGMKIKNPACVKKTFPNFFQKLAAPPPAGLGALILNAQKRPLKPQDLFAD